MVNESEKEQTDPNQEHTLDVLHREGELDAVFAYEFMKGAVDDIFSHTYSREQFVEILKDTEKIFGPSLTAYMVKSDYEELNGLSHLVEDENLQEMATRLNLSRAWFVANYYVSQPVGLEGLHKEATRNLKNLARNSLIIVRPEFDEEGLSVARLLRDEPLEKLVGLVLPELIANTHIISRYYLGVRPQWDIFSEEPKLE